MAGPATITDTLLRNRHFLDDYSNGMYQELSNDLKKAQKAILGELESLAKGDMKGIVTRAHHRKLLAEITQTLKDTYGDFPDQIEDGMGEVAKLEYNTVANALRSQAGMELISQKAPNMGMPGQAIKELYSMPVGGALLEDWVDKQHANAKSRLRSAVSQGLIRGLSMQRTADEITKGVDMKSEAKRS